MAHGHGEGPIDPDFDAADPEYGATPPGSTYEHTDAHTRIIAKFMLWLGLTAVLSHVGMGFVYQMFIEQGIASEAAEVRYPTGRTQLDPDRLPPAPRLQQSPANEYYEFRRDEEAIINGYGWQSRDEGTVRIPISQAMRLTVQRGLPSRAQDGAPATDPGLVPADSSAGRTLERRRQ